MVVARTHAEVLSLSCRSNDGLGLGVFQPRHDPCSTRSGSPLKFHIGPILDRFLGVVRVVPRPPHDTFLIVPDRDVAT